MNEPEAEARPRAAWEREAVPTDDYDRIADALASPQSPVGIDAKHTHVLILHALQRIERRLEALERAVEASSGGRPPGADAPIR